MAIPDAYLSRVYLSVYQSASEIKTSTYTQTAHESEHQSGLPTRIGVAGYHKQTGKR